MLEQTFEITSLGKAAAELQATPASIRKAAAAIGLAPTVIISSIPYFTPSDLDKIREHLAAKKQQTT